jgi:hypothetical protein
MTLSCADVVTVWTTTNPAGAANVEKALGAEGIPCFLEGVCQVGWTGLTVNVQVLAGHADRAATVLRGGEQP